ncbi:unannotated protein [freshwater metagenome]|uniref:Unannotated protein n=1 Tax=freshwater metagenome TaxID=449393 RepID=A0A6J5ZVY1_9ZZZZ
MKFSSFTVLVDIVFLLLAGTCQTYQAAALAAGGAAARRRCDYSESFVAHFSSADEIYASLGACLKAAATDPDNAREFQRVGTIVRLETVAPKAQITMKLEADQPVEVEFGESKLRPAAILAMPGDTAQGFWLGEINIITALAQSKMKAQGPVAVILKLVPLVNVVAPLYRLQQEGGGVPEPAAIDDGAGEAEGASDDEAAVDEAPAEEAPQS